MKIPLLSFLMLAAFGGCMFDTDSAEKRFIGQWKSNKQLSIQTFRYPPETKAEAKAYFENLFGRMTLTYTESKLITVLPSLDNSPEFRDESTFTIVGQDETSVSFQYFDTLEKVNKIKKINFEGKDRYWVDLEPFEGREYFDRVNSAK